MSAPDRELNAWASLKKTCQYRSEQDERRDIELYKSKQNNTQLKHKILPSLFAEDGDVDALEAEKEKKSHKSKARRRQKRKNEHFLKDIADTEVKPNEKNDDASAKKATLNDELRDHETSQFEGNKAKRRKKKKRNKADTESDIKKATKGGTFNNIAKNHSGMSTFVKQKQHIDKKSEVNADIKMSDRRLESYGITPNTFKRKKIKEKYRQQANKQ